MSHRENAPRSTWRFVLLVAGGYLLTVVVALALVAIVVAWIDPRGCPAVERALTILLAMVAAWFVASGSAVAALGRRFALTGRWPRWLFAGYLVLLAGTYAFAALALMLALNC